MSFTILYKAVIRHGYGFCVFRGKNRAVVNGLYLAKCGSKMVVLARYRKSKNNTIYKFNWYQ